jgi:hypothetical protein
MKGKYRWFSAHKIEWAFRAFGGGVYIGWQKRTPVLLVLIGRWGLMVGKQNKKEV